jgi:hypothetical protein
MEAYGTALCPLLLKVKSVLLSLESKKKQALTARRAGICGDQSLCGTCGAECFAFLLQVL